MKKWFEKKPVLLICLSMAVNPVTVFAAEPADVQMLPETTQTPDTDVYVRAMTATVLESVEIGM